MNELNTESGTQGNPHFHRGLQILQILLAAAALGRALRFVWAMGQTKP